MTSKLGNIFLITVIALVALTGCEKARDMVADTMPPADTATDMVEAVPLFVHT